MRWGDIQQSYPKAFKKFMDTDPLLELDGDGDLMQNTGGYVNDEWQDYAGAIIADPRRCFDFFDEEGIMIGVQIRTTSEPSFWFQMEINERGVATTPYQAGYFTTRAEAESEAFLKAFEILEGRLK